jgi:Gluconate 2-dehydrogenase subunit 3
MSTLRPLALGSLSRRDFLRVVSVGAMAAAWPLGCGPEQRARSAALSPRFFTDAEFAMLEALCDRILPADHDPGAKQLGAARYIERLLTVFDGDDVPFLFAGGPASGRNPYPDEQTGLPSASFPPNGFAAPIPPTQLQALYWRAELYGGDAAGLPPHIEQQWGGTLRGLREIYLEGLAIANDVAISTAGAPFAELPVEQQDALLAALDGPGVFPPDPVRKAKFLDHVIRHTIEGCLSAPEYGGNQDGAGWRMVGLEGDSQPLGYSIYVAPTDSLAERPDHPLSTANPDELVGGVLTPKPLSADGAQIQATIASYTGALENLSPGACGCALADPDTVVCL